jgi:hypothetical protein
LIGQGLLHGQLLYRDLRDNKPPGIFHIYALIVKLFGAVMWSVGVVDILWLLVTCYCIFRFAQRYLGVPAAALAMVFFASWDCTFGYIFAVQPESLVMLLVVARHDTISGISFTGEDSEECLQTFPGMANLLASRYEPVRNLWDFEIYRLK